jgi:hypothetical protein
VVEKEKKNTYFVSRFRSIQMQFLMPMASVYSLGGTWVVRLARERVWGCFFSEFKVGVEIYLEHICVHLGGFFLEKVPVSCR